MNWSSFLVCSFLLICLHGVLAQDEPQINKIILPEIKRKGMTGYLNCTVTRQGNNNVRWYHQGRQRYISQDDRITIDPRFNIVKDGYPKYEVFRHSRGDSFTYQLVVHRLSELDNGTYVCQVVVLGTDIRPQKDGKLIVLVPPDIQPGITTQTVDAPVGGNATLTCGAQGYPTPNITWVRPNGKPVPGRGYSYQGDVLTLTDLTEDDRGVYRCIADNNVRPPATYDATVYVEFSPRARAVQSSYGQAQNMMYDLTIECIVAGWPPPDMNWYKVEQQGGLKQITDDDKHSVNLLLSHGNFLSISEVWYQLTIFNVQAGDYGDYKCEGINKLGVHRANTYVYETSECQGANCPLADYRSPTGGATDCRSMWGSLTLMVVAACWMTSQ